MALNRDDRKQAVCELCGEPMPPGEETFRFHSFGEGCKECSGLHGRYFNKTEKSQTWEPWFKPDPIPDYRDMTPYERGIIDGLNIAKSICGELKTGTVRDAIEHIDRRLTNAAR